MNLATMVNMKINSKNKKKKRSGTEYVLCDTEEKLDKAREVLTNKELLAVDIETNNTLDPFSKNACIWTISFGYDKGKAMCIALDHPANGTIDIYDKGKKLVTDILKLKKIKKVFHNCVFDMKWLRKFGYEVNGVCADTMIISYLLDENRQSNSLKKLVDEYLDGYDNEFTENLQDLAEYNCEDTDYTLQLFHMFGAKLAETPKLMRLFEKIIMPFCNVIVDMELTGIVIDSKYAEKLKVKYQKKLKVLNESMREDYPASKNVDLGSPKQLSDLLFRKLKFNPIKQTKTGYSVDHEVLVKLADRQKCGLAKYLLKVRKIEKALSTYVDKLPKMVNSDGRLRGGFNIVGTRTGRLSSQNPNLQNIPRDKDIKKMFRVPDGYKLMNIDASQAELRVGCSIAGERTMIKAYNQGTDIHTLTASKVLNKKIQDVTKADRQKAKGVNFGFIYGASAEGFMYYAENTYGLKFTLPECENIRRQFFNAYPGFLTWYRRTKVALRDQGQIEYPTGRIARFPEVKGTSEIPNSILRKAVNYPVQGSSSDIILYTMVSLNNLLKKSKMDAKIIITVHDSIVLEVKDGLEQDILEEVQNITKYDIPKHFSWLKVPMVFDHCMGRSWGEVE